MLEKPEAELVAFLFSLRLPQLLGGQVLGRTLSVVLDGAPSGQVLPLFIVEAVGTIALVMLRPR